jgi:26S proteasome regulatory subunit N3
LTQRGDFDAQYGEEFDLAKSVLGRLQKVVEVDIYLQTLYLIWLVQHRHIAEAQQFALRTLQTISELNKRYVDPLSSIVYFYLSRSFELAGQLKEIREYLHSIYARTLLSGYRNCSLNHDDAGQAVLLNLILRNYLQYNQYEQAHNFVEVTSFPEISAGNEVVRYLYYTGTPLSLTRRSYQGRPWRLCRRVAATQPSVA